MNKPQILSTQEAFEQAHGKVLLINPPVIDSRYEWIKWNQPLGLLKLGTALKQTRDCQVKLFDFMLPTPAGTVPRRQSKLETNLPPGEPIHWLFGQPWDEFDNYLDHLVEDKWIPDSVWITTLTSFWWQTVPLVADRIKNKLRRPLVVLCGNYPFFHTQHAAQFCPNVNIVVKKEDGGLDLAQYPADFSLYDHKEVSFGALDLFSPGVVDEIVNATQRGISHFAFFNENIFDGFDSHLKPILNDVVRLRAGNRKLALQFHGICGVQASDFPIEHAQLLNDANFSELHLEPALTDEGTVNEPLYRTVMQACQHAGFVHQRGSGWESRTHYLSGFFWVGRPYDDLEKLVWNALKLTQLVGMVIPKPYSPTPGTADYALLASHSDYVEPEDISPHRLLFSKLNGIDRNDYQDLYRMTAFLNSKVRSQTFDFLGSTYLAQVIRESLADRKWDI